MKSFLSFFKKKSMAEKSFNPAKTDKVIKPSIYDKQRISTKTEKPSKTPNGGSSKRDRMLEQIIAAEESCKKGDNLLSLQHYLKLLSIDPYSTIENVSWSWVNGAWFDNSQAFHYKEWIKIKSSSNEVIDLFKRAFEFPRQRKETDAETTTKLIIEGLIRFIGLPGQKPNEEILEIFNAKKNDEQSGIKKIEKGVLAKEESKTNNIICAKCNKEFIWNDIYHQKNTPGSEKLHQGSDFHPRAFCPKCGYLVLEYGNNDKWQWHDKNFDINNGKDLPKSPMVPWGHPLTKESEVPLQKLQIDLNYVKSYF